MNPKSLKIILKIIIIPFLLTFSTQFSPSSSSSNSNLQISISPTTLNKSGDPITITWSNVKSPSKLDWVGIYTPPNSTHQNFIGYHFLSSSPNYMESGSGSITFPLINMRSEYQFRFFNWLESEINPKKKDHDQNPIPGTKTLLGESEIVSFQSLNGPGQVHLSLTGRVGEMRVMFVTGDGVESFVRYGLTRLDMGRVVGCGVERYGLEDMCDGVANTSLGWRDPGFIHDGVMVGLDFGKRYFYQVGSDSGGWSEIYSFISQPKDSSETNAFLFGDMGTATPYKTFIRTQDESISTLKWISRDIDALGNKPAMISHIGDISYARGHSWIWDNFFNQIEPLASKVPYHVCIGNHEYDWPLQPWKPDWSYSVYGKDGGGECGVPYSLRFHMPGNSSEPTGAKAPATRNLYYSFDMGVVHFVYFSTETNFLPGGKQYDFLKHDLESVDRRKTPFVVVQGHRPMYTTSHETTDVPFQQRLQMHLEPLFVENKVTIALWGHVHRYERFCPLNNYTCGNEGLPVHLVIGMAGQDWQPIWQPRPDHPDVPIFPQPVWSLYRGGVFGYVRLVANNEKLTLSYVGNHDGEVHDTVEIMASGQVFNGGASDADVVDGSEQTGKSSFSWYFKVGSLTLLGAFLGYVAGFVTRSRKDRARWTPVKSDDPAIS